MMLINPKYSSRIKQKPYIDTEGWHEVCITEFECHASRNGRGVLFTLEKDNGQFQLVNFRLTGRFAKPNRILEFLEIALKGKIRPSSIANPRLFQSLIGRRLEVYVKMGRFGVYIASAYREIAQ